MNEQTTIIELLRSQIDQSNSIIQQYKKDVLSIEQEEQLHQALSNDKTSIIEIDFQSIKNIVEKFQITDEETKTKLLNELFLSKEILKMNKEEHTTVELDTSQQEALDIFLSKLTKVIASEKEMLENPNSDYNHTLTLEKKYKNLLSLLNNPNNKELITDTETIATLIKESKIEESEKRKIILFLMKYNQVLYNSKQGETVPVKEIGERLDEESVKEIFQKFDYNFEKLSSDMQTDILEYGNLENIGEVLLALKENKYSHFDLNKNQDKNRLFSLILQATKEIIDENTTFATENGLNQNQVLTMPGILMKQSRGYSRRKQTTRTTSSKKKVSSSDTKDLLTGSAEDFRKNIELLKANGLSADLVYRKCKTLLTLPHKKLVRNLSLFQKYGFSFNERNKETDPALTSLVSANFADITDQFIEIHPEGLQYLRQNLSNLAIISNPKSLIFYNIYKTREPYMDETGTLIDGPFKQIKDANSTTLQLRGEVTKRGKYKDYAFLGITEENKEENTGTFTKIFENQEQYNEIMDNVDSSEIDDDIFEDPYIQKINEYSDPNEPLAYNFDGIRISKLKVLRVYNTLLKSGVTPSKDSFMYAISYNTIISENNYNKLDKLVEKQITGGKNK